MPNFVTISVLHLGLAVGGQMLEFLSNSWIIVLDINLVYRGGDVLARYFPSKSMR